MNWKNIIWWAIVTVWILTWCSNNKENNNSIEEQRDTLTIINDSTNKTLIEVIDQDKKDELKMRRSNKYNKIPLMESNNNINNKPENIKDSIKHSTGEDIIRMYEAWIDDADEMKAKYEKNYINDHSSNIWAFIITDTEWETIDEEKNKN